MSEATKPDPFPQPKRRLVHNPDVCIGCGICELSCSLVQNGSYGRALALLKLHRNYYRGSGMAAVSSASIFVVSVPGRSVSACPVGAIHIDPETKARVIDEELCTGCQLCPEACPYDMITCDDDKGICTKRSLWRGSGMRQAVSGERRWRAAICGAVEEEMWKSCAAGWARF